MQTEMFTWKLVLAYDGSEFHGWQIQPDQPTVQGLLRDALLRITGEDVLPQGSGRTDAGVHALGQVASFALAAPIPETNLARALNRTLPASIRVLSASRAGSDRNDPPPAMVFKTPAKNEATGSQQILSR